MTVRVSFRRARALFTAAPRSRTAPFKIHYNFQYYVVRSLPTLFSLWSNFRIFPLTMQRVPRVRTNPHKTAHTLYHTPGTGTRPPSRSFGWERRFASQARTPPRGTEGNRGQSSRTRGGHAPAPGAVRPGKLCSPRPAVTSVVLVPMTSLLPCAVRRCGSDDVRIDAAHTHTHT